MLQIIIGLLKVATADLCVICYTIISFMLIVVAILSFPDIKEIIGWMDSDGYLASVSHSSFWIAVYVRLTINCD